MYTYVVNGSVELCYPIIYDKDRVKTWSFFVLYDIMKGSELGVYFIL